MVQQTIVEIVQQVYYSGMEEQDTNPLDEALRIIDNALAATIGRELLSMTEVSDVLLDVRTVLVRV